MSEPRHSDTTDVVAILRLADLPIYHAAADQIVGLRAEVQRLEAKAEALDLVAAWYAENVAGNEITISDFDPPGAFVRCVAAELVCNPRLGWPDEDAARHFLMELWPDATAGVVGTENDRGS